jgi:hypothetical protein
MHHPCVAMRPSRTLRRDNGATTIVRVASWSRYWPHGYLPDFHPPGASPV